MTISRIKMGRQATRGGNEDVGEDEEEFEPDTAFAVSLSCRHT